MLTQDIKLNIIPNGKPIIVHCNQNDDSGNRLYFYFFLNGEPYLFDRSITHMYLRGTKPNGEKFSHIINLYRNEYAYYSLEDYMTDVAGDVYCNIEINEGNDRIGTQAFILRVQEETK